MNRLQEIIRQVEGRLAEEQQQTPAHIIEERIRTAPPALDFAAALRPAPAAALPAVIAELKRASPSKGLIREHFPVAELARQLQEAGAAALSVLTERDNFLGAPGYLQTAVSQVNIPVLRKDFILHEYQLLQARAWGASAALLIVAALTPPALERLLRKAGELHLDILTETHDEDELRTALDAGARIIGVNSRNLKTFQTDLAVAERMMAMIPDSCIRVAESGIKNHHDMLRLRQSGADAVLVGETLMRHEHPGKALAALLQEP